MWTDHLANKLPITGCFSGPVPELERMRLLKFCIEPSAQSITFLLEWSTMPSGTPDKWKQRGHHALQLILNASFDGRVVLEGAFDHSSVDVELSSDSLSVMQENSATTLRIVPWSVTATLVPYSGDSLHHGVRLSSGGGK